MKDDDISLSANPTLLHIRTLINKKKYCIKYLQGLIWISDDGRSRHWTLTFTCTYVLIIKTNKDVVTSWIQRLMAMSSSVYWLKSFLYRLMPECDCPVVQVITINGTFPGYFTFSRMVYVRRRNRECIVTFKINDKLITNNDRLRQALKGVWPDL